MADKVRLYLEAGIPLVWIVDTFFSTVTVHRPGAQPQPFNEDQEITAEPFLPGFREAVADLFEGSRGLKGILIDRNQTSRSVVDRSRKGRGLPTGSLAV